MPAKIAQISRSTAVRAVRGVGSGPHLASALQEGRKNANIHVRSGAIWGIPVKVFSAREGTIESNVFRENLRRVRILNLITPNSEEPPCHNRATGAGAKSVKVWRSPGTLPRRLARRAAITTTRAAGTTPLWRISPRRRARATGAGAKSVKVWRSPGTLRRALPGGRLSRPHGQLGLHPNALGFRMTGEVSLWTAALLRYRSSNTCSESPASGLARFWPVSPPALRAAARVLRRCEQCH